MSGMTTRKMTDLILDAFGVYKTGELPVGPQWVNEQVLIARNHFRKIDVERSINGNELIEDKWFTERTATIQYDTDREQHYATLENGYVSLPNDMGVRILPYSGSYNPFIRCPRNFTSLRPDLAFAEGNILYTVHQGKVSFPWMRRIPGSGEIILEVIEDGPPDDIDAPLPMPDRFQAMVQDMVVEKMLKMMGEDRKTDSKTGDAA
jgi:hypothetical protein